MTNNSNNLYVINKKVLSNNTILCWDVINSDTKFINEMQYQNVTVNAHELIEELVFKFRRVYFWD